MGVLCSCTRATRNDVESSQWDDHFPPMTRSELRNKREIFWATRSSGIREIWYGLKSAVELIRDAEDDTAQAIISAIGCTALQLQQTKKAFFCYDERGSKYVMPVYLFEEPKNLIENKGLTDIQNNSDEKEKINLQSNEEISFRVRLNIGQDINVTMTQQKTIKELQNHLSTHLNNLDPSKIKIIKRGRMLSNTYRIGGPFPINNHDIIHGSIPSSLYKKSKGCDILK
eukprot:776854_1